MSMYDMHVRVCAQTCTGECTWEGVEVLSCGPGLLERRVREAVKGGAMYKGSESRKKENRNLTLPFCRVAIEASYLTSLSLNFLVQKMGIVLQDCCMD